MAMVMSGKEARAPGRDGMYDTGLFLYNREDMTFRAMQARAAEWSKGDLFAVFRDELGGTHAQYSRFDDFSEVALTQLVRTRRGFERAAIDHETLLYLVAVLMISRIHDYHFENFVGLYDHRGTQVFDLKGLYTWVSRNEELFMTDAEAAVEMEDIDALREEYAMERAA